jgi:hypothetical protein
MSLACMVIYIFRSLYVCRTVLKDHVLVCCYSSLLKQRWASHGEALLAGRSELHAAAVAKHLFLMERFVAEGQHPESATRLLQASMQRGLDDELQVVEAMARKLAQAEGGKAMAASQQGAVKQVDEEMARMLVLDSYGDDVKGEGSDGKAGDVVWDARVQRLLSHFQVLHDSVAPDAVPNNLEQCSLTTLQLLRGVLPATQKQLQVCPSIISACNPLEQWRVLSVYLCPCNCIILN